MPLTKAQTKYVKGKMRNIMRQKAVLDLENADWFTANTARIAAQQYINVDMIKEKIKNAAYYTLNDIGDDFELLVSNAVGVFGSTRIETLNARAVRDEFYKQMQGCPVAHAGGTEEDDGEDEDEADDEE